jgi:hypothetical protein
MIESHRKRYIPNISFSCPIKPGKYYAMNIMEYMGDERAVWSKNASVSKPDGKPKNGLGVDLPNGKYRYTFKISTNTDPFVYLVQWQLDVNSRLNEDKF